jgi:phenylalanyl-tRNA synthetase alpha chain
MDELDALVQQLLAEVAEAASSEALHRVEVRALGSKGAIQAQLRSIGSLPKEERPAFGARVNEAKQRVLEAIEARRGHVQQLEAAARLATESLDVTLPGDALPAGGIHPLTGTVRRIKQVLSGLGFEFVDGPELESYRYNFAALNYPEDHPAFDEQMTFYVDDTHLLRTQTTALQGRVMSERRPPFRIATVGRCHRYEAVDATHHHTFHQVDAFMVDRGVSMAHLKGTLKQFASRMFGGDLRLRFRPDFFPFVEPGVDYAIWWQEKWLELGGAGLIHPNILEAHGIDSEVYSGFAFGLGIERIHMIQRGVRDLRYYLENDLRFLQQR